ncbi:DUF5641 domain-containing protein [Trichonephila clavata]|uniref:DUF5641 domain-containing protein n=1 Tax=Trichonephila clavata TaxID=2740835 RepID=A0A8X6K867_TRICU|nr:DUF5641 domain-containing protein [Trichonephila clavata]
MLDAKLGGDRKKGHLSLDELESAEIQLIRSDQAQCFVDEKNEYLGQLIQRQKQHPQSSNICEGKIVLIGDDYKKRLQWPLARVMKLIPGKDGLVRTVKLRTQSCTLFRPIQRVFPLEVSGNIVTSLPLQKVQQIDSSMNCADPDTLKATEKPQVTRCGRPVKKPDKLNLLTLTDVFD